MCLMKSDIQRINNVLEREQNMWRHIKNGFKRFFPIPARTHNAQMSAVLESFERAEKVALDTNKKTEKMSREIEKISKKIEWINEKTDKINEKTDKISKRTDWINEKADKVSQKTEWINEKVKALSKIQVGIKRFEKLLPEKKILWNRPVERQFVQSTWGCVADMPDFEQKFLKLIAGLDNESITTIVRIVSRQRKYLNSDEDSLNLFTLDEQSKLRELSDNFYNEIFMISNDLYIYKNYLLPTKHFEANVFYYKHGLSKVKTIERVRGKDIIDAGGFIGDSVLILNELHPERIFSFEAVPENYELLIKTLELNRIRNTVAENVALGAFEGTITMHLAGICSTAFERSDIEFNKHIEAPVITLDSYVKKHDLNVGLIKVDIEGAEMSFLEGAKQTICEQKPILLLSIYHNPQDFFGIKPLIESWNLGYSFYVYKPVLDNTTTETTLIAEIVNPD